MPTNFAKYGTVVNDLSIAEISETLPKSFWESLGEFVAPTTLETIRTVKAGEKPSLRQLLGTGLEVGSFLIPGGAAVKGAAAGVRAVRGARATQKALTLGQKAAKVGSVAKGAAKGGAISGALFGAGRGLGDEETSFKEVAGQAALTAGAGAVGGAVLGPVLSLGAMGAKGLYRFTSSGIRRINKTLKPQNKKIAIDTLAEAYQKSFVVDKSSINNKLDTQIVISRRVKGPDSKTGLIRELAEEGYLPKIEGKLANMRPVIDDISSRIGRAAGWIDSLLEPIKTKTSLSGFQERVKNSLAGDYGSDINKALGQVDVIFKSFQQKFGKNLSAVEVNSVRKEMNKVTKAFNKESFINDAANTVARTAREILDELAPNDIIRKANAEIGRLFRIKELSNLFNNKAIDVGFIGQAVGRYIGVAAGGSAGFSIAGPGGLVVAGVLANAGSKAIANMIRKFRFNPKIIDIITQGLNKDKQLLNKLIKEASPGDAAILRGLIPKGKGGIPSTTIKSKPIILKELEPLAQEARKFDTAEEFLNSVTELPIENINSLITRKQIINRLGKIESKTPDTPVIVEIVNGKINILDGNQRFFQKLDKGDKTIKIRFAPVNTGEVNTALDFFQKAKGK